MGAPNHPFFASVRYWTLLYKLLCSLLGNSSFTSPCEPTLLCCFRVIWFGQVFCASADTFVFCNVWLRSLVWRLPLRHYSHTDCSSLEPTILFKVLPYDSTLTQTVPVQNPPMQLTLSAISNFLAINLLWVQPKIFMALVSFEPTTLCVMIRHFSNCANHYTCISL